MNILQQEDIIKGLPDQALQEEAKRPSGQVPQFLVVSEIQRRTDMRKRYQDPNQQQPQGTIADQITQEGIASVQPQQPMQGQQQQGQPMPMRVGGMTPFMRKYAGGGVVRMQEGGITPHEMAQMDAQMMAQKYPFLSGSRDEILQGLSTVDPNDVSYISSMFNGVPEIEQFIANRASNPAPPLSAVRPELFDAEMPQPPMPVENVTDPRLLTLDGVNTLTPDGQRPYPPNTPSVDTLEQFSNAFREDAARVENLLATLDDSTAKEKEAISNPVNVNLPKIRTLTEIGEQAPQSLKGTGVRLASYQEREDAKYDPSSFGAMFDGSSREFPSRAKRVIGSNLSDLGSFLSDQFQDVKSSAGSSIDQGFNYLPGGADKVEREREDIGPYSLNSGLDASQGIFPINGSDSSNASSSKPVGTGTVLREPVGTNTVLRKDNGMYLSKLANSDLLSNLERKEVTPVAEGNGTVISDGANNEGSGDKGVNNSNKAVNLLNNAFALDLDATKKEAFAMAMIQLGAGIAKGDLAEGLSNAGVAASGVMESARDRSDKQLDREIQGKYFDEKLSDSRLDRDATLKSRAQSESQKMLAAWYKTTEGMKSISDPSIATAKEIEFYELALRRLTQGSTGSDMRRGGNLAESLNEDPLGLRKT
jgi:hypothetical protein